MDPATLLVVAVIGGIAYLATREEDEPEKPAPAPAPAPSPAVPVSPVKPPVIGPAPAPEPAPSVPSAPTIPGTSAPQPPPNASGDAAGYNTELFPHSMGVNKALKFLGYAVNPDSASPPPASQVKKFQGHYNQSSVMSEHDAVGWVSEDGIAGKYTLRALELAVAGPDGPDLGDFPRGYAWAQSHGL